MEPSSTFYRSVLPPQTRAPLTRYGSTHWEVGLHSQNTALRDVVGAHSAGKWRMLHCITMSLPRPPMSGNRCLPGDYRWRHGPGHEHGQLCRRHILQIAELVGQWGAGMRGSAGGPAGEVQGEGLRESCGAPENDTTARRRFRPGSRLKHEEPFACGEHAQEAARLDAQAMSSSVGPVPTAAGTAFVRNGVIEPTGYDYWVAQTAGQLITLRLGWQLATVVAEAVDPVLWQTWSAWQTGEDGQSYVLTAQSTTLDLRGLPQKAAGGGGSSSRYYYCQRGPKADGGFIPGTQFPSFLDCQGWVPTTDAALGNLSHFACCNGIDCPSSCVGSSCASNISYSPPPPPPPATPAEIRQAQVDEASTAFDTQRKAATALSAASVAFATAGSTAISAAVSGMAAQAAAAIGTVGGQIGLEGALASVGIQGMVGHLQMFALSGE